MKPVFLILFACMVTAAVAQDYAFLLKEAQNLERSIKEPEALSKYELLQEKYPNDVVANIKCAQLLIATGNRLVDAKQKFLPFKNAEVYAERAWKADSVQAEVLYTRALVARALAEIETSAKNFIPLFSNQYHFAQRGLSAHKNYGKLNYEMGMWHIAAMNLSGKKAIASAVSKTNLPKPSIDSAIFYFENCKKLEPYFAANYLELAKCYQKINRPAAAIEVLTALVKLPLRTADDAAIKKEGKKMLDENL